MAEKILRCYDAPTLRALFTQAGTLALLERKGFRELEVVIDWAGRALPHVLLVGTKGGTRYVLLDAILGETTIEPAFFAHGATAISRPVDLAVVHWLREEDPTATFEAGRPALPLQHHPGLGILRSAFRAVVRIARELGKDGVASTPKFFHDAVIFYRSRLFLFLDGEEQGRFEALLRDTRPLGLGDASLALLSGGVRDHAGRIAAWTPSLQVFPLSSELTGYFNDPVYAARVASALDAHRFTIDHAALQATRLAATSVTQKTL
jgi:hypothetical protein